MTGEERNPHLLAADNSPPTGIVRNPILDRDKYHITQVTGYKLNVTRVTRLKQST